MTYCLLTILNILYVLAHLILTWTLWRKYYYYPQVLHIDTDLKKVKQFVQLEHPVSPIPECTILAPTQHYYNGNFYEP